MLTTLGDVRLQMNGEAVDLGLGKPCGLLVFLALHEGQALHRGRITSMFWGTHFQTQANQNFRKALSRLRTIIGGDAIIADGDRIAVRPGAVWIDVVAFERCVAQSTIQSFQEAAGLYRGDFLAGVSIDQPAWLEWVSGKRRSLAHAACDALIALGTAELTASSVSALRRGEQALELNPSSEAAHRLVLSALVQDGRRFEALQRHEGFVLHLRRQLGAPPDQVTEDLANAIRMASPSRSDPTPATPSSTPQTGSRKPSIAVLRFRNVGSTPNDYFSDGMADEIIAALSRLRWMTVLSRNTSFTFAVEDARQIGRDFDIDYVLTGRIHAEDGQIRISTELVDSRTGLAIVAHRYDRVMKDVFALQDELTEHIAAAIEPTIRSNEISRVRSVPTSSLDAYQLYLRALAEVYKLTEESFALAVRFLRNAIEIDPYYSDALAALADCLCRQWVSGWVIREEIEPTQAEALKLAQRAVSSDPHNAAALAVLSYAFGAMRGRFDEALDMVERFLNSGVSSDYLIALCGQVLLHAGESDRAIELFFKARRLNPVDHRGYVTLNGIAMAHFHAERFEDAEMWSRRALSEQPKWNVARRYHAAALAHLGRITDAQAEVAILLSIQPNSSLARSRTSFFRYPYMYDQYLTGLRLAGLPET